MHHAPRLSTIYIQLRFMALMLACTGLACYPGHVFAQSTVTTQLAQANNTCYYAVVCNTETSPPVELQAPEVIEAKPSEFQQPSVNDSDLPAWMLPGVERINYNLGELVDNTSRGIDRFFGTDDSLFVDNQSYLRLRQESVLRDGKRLHDLSVRFRLDLPTAQKRLHLLIESERDDVLSNPQQIRSATRPLDQRLSGDTSLIGVEAQGPQDDESWRNRLGAGVRIRSQFDPYVRFTSQKHEHTEDEAWQFGFFNRLMYFHQKGFTNRIQVDVTHPLNSAFNIRSVLQSEYVQHEHKTRYVHSLELNQILDSRTGMRYALLSLGDTAQSKTLFEHVLQLYWRRDIHKKVMFVDVIPEWHMPTIAGNQDYWALVFRLEFIFAGQFNQLPSYRAHLN